MPDDLPSEEEITKRLAQTQQQLLSLLDQHSQYQTINQGVPKTDAFVAVMLNFFDSTMHQVAKDSNKHPVLVKERFVEDLMDGIQNQKENLNIENDLEDQLGELENKITNLIEEELEGEVEVSETSVEKIEDDTDKDLKEAIKEIKESIEDEDDN